LVRAIAVSAGRAHFAHDAVTAGKQGPGQGAFILEQVVQGFTGSVRQIGKGLFNQPAFEQRGGQPSQTRSGIRCIQFNTP
jgi:hypothetical protein